MSDDRYRFAIGVLGRAPALLAALAVGCADGGPGEAPQPLLSESDDRREPYETEFPWMRSLAEYGTVALVHESFVRTVTTPATSYLTLDEGSQTLGESLGLCPGERYATQRRTSFCSGTLIDDDLVLTAGSCLNASRTCANTRFVFDHFNIAPGVHAPVVGGIYGCREVVLEQDGNPDLGEPNFAVIRLDSPVTGRFQPVPVRTARGLLDPGQHVKLVGHPYGIPVKIDAQGNVVNNALRPNHFLASLDTFAGAYGGGVYESDSYTLAGILVGHALRPGDDPALVDYIPRGLPDGGTCNVATGCTTPACGTAAVLQVSAVLDALCAVPSRSPRLCGTAPPPNDRVENAAMLPLGYDVTLAGSTAFAGYEGLRAPCSPSTPLGPDVFYRFHADVPLVLYIDAFNSDYPVLLNLFEVTTGGSLACNASACGLGRGQVTTFVPPGTYRLQVSGWQGARGRFSLHVQALAGSSRTVRVPRGARVVTGTDLGPVYAGRNTCGGTPASGVLYYYTTCPEYRGGTVRASTCGRASWDTVLSFAQGNARAVTCIDDTCGDQSTLRATATPGSGLRGVYLDAPGAAGPYELFLSIP